ncbi:hypothetical protein AAMO2058_000678100 [Amorphochlora amoebiformis]
MGMVAEAKRTNGRRQKAAGKQETPTQATFSYPRIRADTRRDSQLFFVRKPLVTMAARADVCREEINFTRLLGRCEFLGCGENPESIAISKRKKYSKYLEVLKGKVDTLKRHRANGIPLEIGARLDKLGARVETMYQNVHAFLEANADRETHDSLALESPLLPSDDELSTSSRPQNPHLLLLRWSPLPGVKPLPSSPHPTSKSLALSSPVGPRYVPGLPATGDQRASGVYERKREERWRAKRVRRKGGSVQARMQEEKDKQETLQREILELTNELKHLQVKISRFFDRDGKTIDSVTKKMEDNLSRTQREKKRLDDYSSRSSDTCRTWSTLVFVAASFTSTYIFIRLFPL